MDYEFAQWEKIQLEKHISIELLLRAEYTKRPDGSLGVSRAWKKKSDKRLEEMKARLSHLEWVLEGKAKR